MTASAISHPCAEAEEPSAFGTCHRQLSCSSGIESARGFHLGLSEAGFSSWQSQLLRSGPDGPDDSLSL